MKVLLVNKYFYLRGGSEYVFFDTVSLLEEHGHQVQFLSMDHPQNFPNRYQKYFVSNVDYNQKGITNKISSSMKIFYSLEAKKKIEQLIKDEKPDIAHLNNIYHQISPSILPALKKAGIPIVMTLHDHKMVCASYLLQKKGQTCQDCKGNKYYKCFTNKCIKDSQIKSLIGALEMYLHHKLLNIYNLVDIFISPSLFLKNKLVEMGFNKEIVHLPNFVPLDHYIPKYDHLENSIVYFGRLSTEKGIITLIDAVKSIQGISLKLIGDGPLKNDIENKIKKENINNIFLLGYKTGEDLKREISKSILTVFPSECNENNPRAIIEAYALGKTVVASRIGGIPELVKDNETGILFEPGNAVDLNHKLKNLLSNKEKIIQLGKNARHLVNEQMNPDTHYKQLMQIYKKAKAKKTVKKSILMNFLSLALGFITLIALNLNSAIAQETITNKISVFYNTELGDVKKEIFGTNLIGYDPNTYEDWGQPYHGYTNYGAGIWNPETKQSVKEVIALAKEAGITVVRFPGGCGTHRYDWKKTIGKDRKNFLFGLDEFLQVAKEINAKPIITLSYFTGNEKDKADLIEYLNAPNNGSNPNGGADWAKIRAENGHTEPYNVEYFEFGNEDYHGDHKTIKRIQAKDYALNYLKNYDAMKAVDPNIKIACIMELPEWNNTIMDLIKEKVDFAIIHSYPSPEIGEMELPFLKPAEVFRITLAMPELREQLYIQETSKILNEKSGKIIPIAITEYNSGLANNKPIAYRHCMGTALVNAELLKMFMNPENNIFMANYWQFNNSFWGMIANKTEFMESINTEYYKRPNFFVAKLYNKHFGDKLIKTSVECPTYDITEADPVWSFIRILKGDLNEFKSKIPFVSVNASKKDDKVFLIIVNKNMKESYQFNFELSDFIAQEKANISVLNGPFVTSMNEKNNNNVTITTSETSIIDGKNFNLTLQPHSITSIEIERKP